LGVFHPQVASRTADPPLVSVALDEPEGLELGRQVEAAEKPSKVDVGDVVDLLAKAPGPKL